MRHITKGSEPESLTQFKRDGGTEFDNEGLRKSEIQQQLLYEQKGLCAYCLCRIHVEKDKLPKIGIEHIKCRTNHPDLQLDYNNMLGVCKGGENNPKQKPHCDKSKDRGNFHYEIKKLNPLNLNVESLIEYIDNGTIKSVDNDSDVEEDIKSLNLNEYFTRINRERILSDLKDSYKRIRTSANKALVQAFIQKQITKWTKLNKHGYLPEYNLVALKFLQKRQGL